MTKIGFILYSKVKFKALFICLRIEMHIDGCDLHETLLLHNVFVVHMRQGMIIVGAECVETHLAVYLNQPFMIPHQSIYDFDFGTP